MKKKPFVVAVTTLVFVAAIFSGECAVTKLPGEGGTKNAISSAPFPDRMSAYVWRNWGLVDKTLLAETVGAKPADLAAVAGQMGLEPDPVVLPVLCEGQVRRAKLG